MKLEEAREKAAKNVITISEKDFVDTATSVVDQISKDIDEPTLSFLAIPIIGELSIALFHKEKGEN